MNENTRKQQFERLFSSARRETPSFQESHVLSAMAAARSSQVPTKTTVMSRWSTYALATLAMISGSVWFFTHGTTSQRDEVVLAHYNAESLSSNLSVNTSSQPQTGSATRDAAPQPRQITSQTSRSASDSNVDAFHVNRSTSRGKQQDQSYHLNGTSSSNSVLENRNSTAQALDRVWTDSLFANHIVLADNTTIKTNGSDHKDTLKVNTSTLLQDERVLSQLGIERLNKDHIALRGWSSNQSREEFSEFVFSDSKLFSARFVNDTVPPAHPHNRHITFPTYIVSSDGVILMFNDQFLPKTNYDVEETLRLNHEDSILAVIDDYRREAQRSSMQFWLAPTTDTAIPLVRRVEKSVVHLSNAAGQEQVYLRVDVNWSPTERAQQFQREDFRHRNARMMYKDSCLTVCIHPNGVDPLYLLYYPSKDLMDLLPTDIALQVRAEQGNADALRELKNSYKGCRYMSFCSTSSGAIEDTEILGSMSTDTRVRISLKEPRTLRIALYDIAGRVVAEVDKGSRYSSGSSIVPLHLESPETSAGFYLLVITSDASEKVAQRVVLGR